MPSVSQKVSAFSLVVMRADWALDIRLSNLRQNIVHDFDDCRSAL